MPSLKDTKRRIASVKNTQKITRAMKLVAAAKFARASHAVISARPYSAAMKNMMARVLEEAKGLDTFAFLKDIPEKNSLLIIIGTDRGLCGGLNTNLFKISLAWLSQKKQAGVSVKLWAWGRRSQLFCKKRQEPTLEKLEKVIEKPSIKFANEAADKILTSFMAGEFDHVYLAYPEFKSAMVQAPKVMQLLPLTSDLAASTKASAKSGSIILEPGLEELLLTMLKRAVANLIFRAMLEVSASEHGARMSAMDSATNNAKEVIRKLTLLYNRARQAAITKELIEIISGAEAL